MRLVWLTDIHLNFVPLARRIEFYTAVRNENPDAILLGGDTGEADTLILYLGEMERNLRVPIYFVLGNHDFYRGSIAATRDLVTATCAGSNSLHWLPVTGIVPLVSDTALIGHDSWADVRLGNFFGSDVRLNDYQCIHELTGLSKQACFRELNALGDEAANYLRQRATEVLASGRNVLLLTHVPPFREACWHEGQISDDNWLPHFTCKAVGDALIALMREHPDRTMTVLCGHTHGAGTANILPNLTVYTGGAEYGAPQVQAVLNLTD